MWAFGIYRLFDKVRIGPTSLTGWNRRIRFFDAALNDLALLLNQNTVLNGVLIPIEVYNDA